jgi:hypothetical protein
MEAEGALVLALLHGFRTPLSPLPLRHPSHHANNSSQSISVVMAQNEASKRAASMLTIAQHKFKQALKKEDSHESRLPPVAVELSAQFLSDLDAVLKQSTPVNVQVSDYKAIDHFSWGQTNRES